MGDGAGRYVPFSRARHVVDDRIGVGNDAIQAAPAGRQISVAFRERKEEKLPFLVPSIVHIARHAIARQPIELVVEIEPRETIKGSGRGFDFCFVPVKIIGGKPVLRRYVEKFLGAGTHQEHSKT